MEDAVKSTQGLAACRRWEPRRMIACVCCARMFWSEDLKKRHLFGFHADWLGKPREAWELLSAEKYSMRAPLIPREELQASTVQMNGMLVLLHKRRCPEGAAHGEVAVPWCQDCAKSLGEAIL